MKIQVLGTGCKSCENLYQAVMAAVAGLGPDAAVTVEKVNDVVYFAKMGVFMTPGLVIDGTVVSSGKSLTVAQIQARIRERL